MFKWEESSEFLKLVCTSSTNCETRWLSFRSTFWLSLYASDVCLAYAISFYYQIRRVGVVVESCSLHLAVPTNRRPIFSRVFGPSCLGGESGESWEGLEQLVVMELLGLIPQN